MSLHNFEKMYETSIKNVNNSHISARNKEIILSFGNDLLLENLSKARILKYYYALTMFARNLNKDFDKADINDIKILVANIQQNSKYSPWTKKTYKMMIRRFYKLLKGVKGKNKYPEIVDWIPTKIKRSEQRLPSSEDMLNEEDVNKMISKAYHPRDKAFLSVLWESGARIGEIGNLLFKNVVFDDYGTVIVVQGKTGSRKIRLISSTPYLSTWMDSHPLKLQKDSPLWINIGSRNHLKQMDYRNVRRILIELAKRSSINKRVNPHTFRHSRATFMANHLTEFQMNQYFGWIQGSDMPATYVHMSGKEVDNAIFKMNGLQHEDKKESIRKPRVCSRCDSINTFDSAHCRKCGGYLDLKQAMEIEDKKRSVYAQQGLSNDLMTTLLKDKDVQHLLMEKLREIPGISLPF